MSQLMRRVCVCTGTRAEYGLLLPLIRQIDEDPELTLQLLVTGQHLAPQFGNTVKEIEADGLTISAQVEMLMASDSGVSIAKSMSLGLSGFADALSRLSPDLIVVLGDRYEILAAATAALALRIPIAHLHGGEATEGLIDEAIRHSVTKMAHLHFTSTETYRQRVIQLGEQPDRVFNFGAPGLDIIRTEKTLTTSELEQSLGFTLSDPVFLVTFHPVTLDNDQTLAGIEALRTSLTAFPEATIVFTRSNADQGYNAIDEFIDKIVSEATERIHAVSSLGSSRYLSMVQKAKVVIGNSSSGLYEAPFLRTPSVNIGDRQKGRLRAASVIDCVPTAEALTAAIHTSLSEAHLEHCVKMTNIFGDGNASTRIKDVLKSFPIENILTKSFFDLPGGPR
jgi:UDP-hydrolysing UDP-N-acetyl-D-glucosamine 2-epimerase